MGSQRIAWAVFAIMAVLAIAFAWESGSLKPTDGDTSSVAADAPRRRASDTIGHEVGRQVDDIEEAISKNLGPLLATNASLVHPRTTDDCRLWAEAHPKEQAGQDILRSMVFAPYSLSVDKIVYSSTFNPRNTPIPDDLYAPLTNLLQHYSNEFEVLMQAKGRTQAEEISELEATGKLVTKVDPDLLARRQLELVEARLRQDYQNASPEEKDKIRATLLTRIRRADPTHVGFIRRKSKGQVFYADNRTLARTNAIVDYTRFRGAELAYSVIQLAATWGLIEDHEQQVRLDRIAQITDT